MKIIKFYADWCGPCKMITPSIHKLAKKYDAELIELDVDDKENSTMALNYKVRALPTVVFIWESDEIQITGAEQEDVYETAIKKLL